MLDPAAIADERNYEAKDIDHLYIRRTKISREVTNEIGGKWRERGPSVPAPLPGVPGRGEGLRGADAKSGSPTRAQAPGAGTDRRLFPYTLLKTFLSSHKALAATARKRLEEQHRRQGAGGARTPRRASPTRSPTPTRAKLNKLWSRT